jgi:hypothetical protein
LCTGVNSTDSSIVLVSQNDNLNSRAKPLFFKLTNSNPPKYLETRRDVTNSNVTNLTEFCQIENGIYNEDTKYYIDLATNHLIKNNCYISFNNGGNTLIISGPLNCSINPSVIDFKYDTTTKYITLESRNLIYNFLQDVNSNSMRYTNTLNLVVNSLSGTTFDIINNPPVVKYIDIYTYTLNTFTGVTPVSYLAIRTIDNNDYFYLSSTPVQKFYYLPIPNVFMILKDNQYKYMELVVDNITNAYKINYKSSEPLKGDTRDANYLSYGSANKIKSFTGDNCFGKKTINIGGLGNQEFLTWYPCTTNTTGVLINVTYSSPI